MSNNPENIRICPRCEGEIFHKNKYDRNKSHKKQYNCKKCAYEIKRGKPISDVRLKALHDGAKKWRSENPEYSFFSEWKKKYSPEEYEIKIEEVKKKYRECNKGANNNMYGKPTPNGAGNGWKGWYKGFHFRSLRELQFYIKTIEIDKIECINTHLKKEFRVKYIDQKGTERTYSADFLVGGNTIVEVKPKKLQNTLENQCKFKAMEEFCKNNNLIFKVIDIEPDSKLIKQKFLDGEIKFTHKYIDRFKKYAGIE